MSDWVKAVVVVINCVIVWCAADGGDMILLYARLTQNHIS